MNRMTEDEAIRLLLCVALLLTAMIFGLLDR